MVAKIGGWICIQVCKPGTHMIINNAISKNACNDDVMQMLLGSNAYTITKSNINCAQSIDQYISLQNQNCCFSKVSGYYMSFPCHSQFWTHCTYYKTRCFITAPGALHIPSKSAWWHHFYCTVINVGDVIMHSWCPVEELWREVIIPRNV